MPLLAESRGALIRAERQAVNAYVQGFAANITKLAMRQLHGELAEYPPNCWPKSMTRSSSGSRKMLKVRSTNCKG